MIADPLETASVAEQNPEIAQELEKRTRTLVRNDLAQRRAFNTSKKSDDGTVTLTEEESADLRALGYIEE